jgi:hypothetical protein
LVKRSVIVEVTNVQIDTLVDASRSWEPITIIPIGDIQLGAPGCDLDRLKQDVDWGVEHAALFIGMGDYVDVASPSNRQQLRAVKLYDSVHNALRTDAERRIDELMEIFAPTVGSWLGLLEGHHYYDFDDGTTTDTRLANLLNTTFLGSCALIELHFLRSTGNGRRSFTIFAHHGQGSGRSVAAPLASLERVALSFEADLYLMAHQHKKTTAPLSLLYKSGDKLRHKVRRLVGTGGYLRGYQQGSQVSGRPGGSYVEKALMNPVELGAVRVHLKPTHTNDRDYIDFTVEV